MGFDPRHWSGGRSEQRVTSNVEALLAENDALRREVLRLNRELDRLQRQQRQRFRTETTSHRSWSEPSAQAPPRISSHQVQAWGQSLAYLRDSAVQLVLLDEINVALKLGYLAVEDVLSGVDERPEHTHVVLTGRGAPQALIDRADLVTEMSLVKHPFREQGVKAQAGIEF